MPFPPASDYHRVSVNIPKDRLEEVEATARLRGHILLGTYIRSLVEQDVADALPVLRRAGVIKKAQ